MKSKTLILLLIFYTHFLHSQGSGINGEKTEKEISFILPFITKDNAAILITDGETNRSFSKSIIQLKRGKKFTLKLKPTGGFVIKLED